MERTNEPTPKGSAADPYQEPPNSTVDDWLGQRVGRDRELAEECLMDAGGDIEDAERRFQQRSTERAEYEAAHEQGSPGRS